MAENSEPNQRVLCLADSLLYVNLGYWDKLALSPITAELKATGVMNEHERRMFMLMQRFHRSAYDCANEAVSIKLEHLQIHSRATMSGEAVHENHSCDIYNMKIKLILDNQSAHEERKRCLSKILAYTLAFEYGITGNFTLAFFYGGEFVATATDDQLDIPPKGPSLIQLLCMLEKIQ